MKYPVIETERLFLRRPDARDQTMALRQFGAGAHTLSTMSLSEGRAWRQLASFLGHWDLHGYGLFAIVPQGADTPMGLAGPWQPAGWPEREIGWQIWSKAPAAQDLTAEAVRAARDFANRQLGWRDCVSYVAPDDAASARMMQELGAVHDPMAERPDDCPATVYRHPPLRRRLDLVA